ncbi:MAG: flagellar export chaperone FliS [Armatimonadota bacterium]
MSATTAVRAYGETAVRSADRSGLIIVMYEGAIRLLREARALMHTGPLADRSALIIRTQGIITELQLAVDRAVGGPLPESLIRIYAYLHRRLTEANVYDDIERLHEVERIMTSLLEAWRVALAKASKESSDP